MSVEERFWPKVEFEPMSGCWLWNAGAFADGYPAIMVPNPKRMERAHRWSYEHFVGPIPDGEYVCHRCDTPLCVNPSHMFTGTNADNMRDAWSKGRGRCFAGRGMKNPNVSLTRDDVATIRREFDGGVPRGWVGRTARLYGVTRGAISKIVHRRTWRHVK